MKKIFPELLALLRDRGSWEQCLRLMRPWRRPVFILLLVGVIIVMCQWFVLLRSGYGYRTNAPAPQTYRVIAPLRFDDDVAAEALRGMARRSVVGVTVRDLAARDRLHRRLTELRAMRSPAQVRDSSIVHGALLNAIIGLGDERRAALLSMASKVGDAYIDRLESSDVVVDKGMETAILWEEINRLKPSVEDANFIYQILAKVGDLVYRQDNELAEGARRIAEKGIPAIARRLEPGDVIVERGEIVTPQLATLLHMQGYAESVFPVTQLVIVLLLVLVLPLWLDILGRDAGDERPSWMCVMFVVAVAWCCETLAAQVGAPGAGVLPAALTSCLCISGSFAFSVALAGMASGIFIIVGLAVGDMLLFLSMSVVAATLGFYFLRRLESREQLTRRVLLLAIILSQAALGVRWLQGVSFTAESFSLFPVPGYFWVESGQFILVELVLSTIITLFLPMVEGFLDVLSILRLKELAHSSSELLRRLQRLAPGTYQHCLTIATLAEEAADALGLDVNMVRAGAYYHDIGKLRHPHFFVENQGGGLNIHDGIVPSESALVIINHVKDGLALAQEANLPRRICDFIAEHHGTTCVRYFYQKALHQAQERGKGEKVERYSFCYPGPKPQSRETALLMIADSLEAAVRSSGLGQTLQDQGAEGQDEAEMRADTADSPHKNRGRSQSVKAMEQIVDQVIASKVSEGQFDDVNFTQRDITRVKEALMKALLTMYHTRKVKKIESPGAAPAAPKEKKSVPQPALSRAEGQPAEGSTPQAE